MQALPSQPMLLALLAALLVFMLAAATAPDLGTLDLGLGGGGAPALAPAESAPLPAGEPVWVTDPLASPLERLGG